MGILLRKKKYDLFYSITTFENVSNFTLIQITQNAKFFKRLNYL
jgi:hypothetical protein